MDNKYFDKISQLPQFRGSIQSRNQARQLPTGLKAGDIFYIENDNKFQIVIEKNKHDFAFTDLDMNATIATGITIYDLNKSIVAKEPLFNFGNNPETQDLIYGLQEWFDKTNNQFYLMYCRDLHYFTLLKRNDSLLLNEVELMECIADVGNFISADFTDQSIEIWIRTENEPAIVMYILPFDNGIVNI